MASRSTFLSSLKFTAGNNAGLRVIIQGKRKTNRRSSIHVWRAVFDPQNDPIFKKAIQEPVAFFGGFVAGILRLDLNEDPLREWVAKTAEEAGIIAESPKTAPAEEDDSDTDGPIDITIE